ncbi:hypothetical protein STEG23_007032 [Scotinomys teguina]
MLLHGLCLFLLWGGRTTFRERVGRVTSGRLIRKRRRQQRLPNRGAVVGGSPRLREERGVTRKRKPIAFLAPTCWLSPPTMDLLFGRRKTPEELLRQNQRALNRAMRELDRERQKLETQEKKIIADIKKMAKQGQMDAVRIMAKDLVRTRRYVRKFVLMRANIQAVSLKIQTLKSNNSMAQAMKGVTKAMGTMNRQLKLPQIQKIMMEFERQAEIMDMKEEMMNDAIDDAMGDEEDEEEGVKTSLHWCSSSVLLAEESRATASALADADADLEEAQNPED